MGRTKGLGVLSVCFPVWTKTKIFFVWFSFFPFAVCFIFQSVFSFEIKVYFAFNHIFICFVRLVLFGRWLKEAILTNWFYIIFLTSVEFTPNVVLMVCEVSG